jgi:hypothetical protein
MSSKACIICNAPIDGWVYDYATLQPLLVSSKVPPEYVIGKQCISCGAPACAYKHHKELKAGFLGGLEKAICPKCGGSFGPPDSITIREISDIVAEEQPSDLRSLYPWTATFLDVQNGERLLAADQPEIRGDNDFRLLLTDRRLILLPPTKQTMHTVSQAENPENYGLTFPLRTIAGIEQSKPGFGGGTKMVVKTKDNQSYTYQSKIAFANFCSHVQEAIKNAPSALTFPANEIVHFDGGSNFEILNPRDYLSKKGPGIHKNRFFSSYSISLAISSHRILFYRINHLVRSEANRYSVSVQFGPPTLQFISIKCEDIRRIVVDKSFFGDGVSIILDHPVRAWMTNSLTVPSPDEEQMLEDAPYLKSQKDSVPPLGDSGKEWSLPITTKTKIWDSEILPYVKQAWPQVVIEEKGGKK